MLLNAHVHELPILPSYAFLNGLKGVFEQVLPEGVFPFYGVHPWYAESVTDDWLALLVAKVQSTVCGLGEIGLDSVHAKKTGTTLVRQKAVLELQLKLAQKFSRPVSLHAVHAWPDIFELLHRIPVAAMVHQFAGSLETTKRLLDLGVYLSFGPLQHENIVEVIKYMPLDKLFIECENGSDLAELYVRIAALKNIAVEELAARLLQNANIFTGQDWQ